MKRNLLLICSVISLLLIPLWTVSIGAPIELKMAHYASPESKEQEILKAALDDGILQQAQTNAEAYLLKFFAALGFPNTIFTYDQG